MRHIAGLIVVAILAAGCVYEASSPEEELDASLELEWEQVPSITEVGREEPFVSSARIEGVPDGGLVSSQLLVSEDPRERPSPENASLDCFPYPDLWRTGPARGMRSSTECSFDEPGVFFLRGYWEKTWDELGRDGDWLRAWSEPTKVRVLPRIAVEAHGPQRYDPNETVEIDVVVNTSEQIEGHVQVAYAPPGDGEPQNLATFEGRCDADAFQGDARRTIECDWSDGGDRDWVPIIEVETEEGTYTRAGRVDDSWEDYR